MVTSSAIKITRPQIKTERDSAPDTKKNRYLTPNNQQEKRVAKMVKQSHIRCVVQSTNSAPNNGAVEHEHGISTAAQSRTEEDRI